MPPGRPRPPRHARDRPRRASARRARRCRRSAALLLSTRSLVVGGERAVEIGAEQIGAFDEHDAARPPHALERVERGVVVHAEAERRVRIAARAARRPRCRRARRRRGPSARSRPTRWNSAMPVVDHRLRAVAVGDHRPRHVVPGEGVAERAERGVVHARRRSPGRARRCPRCTSPPVDREAGALAEHRPRRCVSP